MRRSLKIAGLVAALGIAAGGIAIAQQAPDGGFRFGRGMPPSPEIMARMLDGKLAGAKAALKLTPDQDKLWPGVEQAVRAAAGKMQTARTEMRGRFEEMRKTGKGPDLLDTLDRGAKRTAEMSDELKKLTEAIRPLYVTLSDDQKQVLALSLRPMRMGHGPRGFFGGSRG